MDDCIFCKIIRREIPSSIVYEDDEIIAFRDVNPVAPVHILVIPKKHISSLIDLKKEDENLIGRIYTVINKIAKQEGIEERVFGQRAVWSKDRGNHMGQNETRVITCFFALSVPWHCRSIHWYRGNNRIHELHR